MSRIDSYRHEFVRSFPEPLQNGVLYVSLEFANVAHRCCCGCGQEVYTPLSPRDWAMTFDGETVSLAPSIGNWSFPCRSHYWLNQGRVSWAKQWTQEQVEMGRTSDRVRKAHHYGAQPNNSPVQDAAQPGTRLGKLLGWLLGR